jgi:hypothetical protein
MGSNGNRLGLSGCAPAVTPHTSAQTYASSYTGASGYSGCLSELGPTSVAPHHCVPQGSSTGNTRSGSQRSPLVTWLGPTYPRVHVALFRLDVPLNLRVRNACAAVSGLNLKPGPGCRAAANRIFKQAKAQSLRTSSLSPSLSPVSSSFKIVRGNAVAPCCATTSAPSPACAQGRAGPESAIIAVNSQLL